ncbi:type VII secretion target [Nocardia brasiliensis]|uniref:type VII secretion target n=1 Tax=Nocardia brasiliensis TaxID=37326 RepID=UPI00340DE5AB
MGGSVTVDPAVLQQIGANLKSSAAVLGNKVIDARRQDFGAAQAGRSYAAEGAKVHDGLVRFATWLQNWQGAVDKTGTQITTSATTYATVDDANVRKITAVGVQLT